MKIDTNTIHTFVLAFIIIFPPIYIIVSKLLRKRKPRIKQPAPKNGDHIRLTCLQNPRNNPHVRSCYIGCSGFVEDVSEDGHFILNMGSSILVVTRDYEYIFI